MDRNRFHRCLFRAVAAVEVVVVAELLLAAVEVVVVAELLLAAVELEGKEAAAEGVASSIFSLRRLVFSSSSTFFAAGCPALPFLAGHQSMAALFFSVCSVVWATAEFVCAAVGSMEVRRSDLLVLPWRQLWLPLCFVDLDYVSVSVLAAGWAFVEASDSSSLARDHN
jgi:hypothetical protein